MVVVLTENAAIGQYSSKHRTAAADVAYFHHIERSVVVVDFRPFPLAISIPSSSCNTAGVRYFAIGYVALQSQPIQISNELSQKSVRKGAVMKANAAS